MRVFVTGATGVIGRRVVPLLVGLGHQVTGLGRTPAGCASLERWGATAARVDLFHAEALRATLHGNDAVVNLATHIPSSSTRMMVRWCWRENDRLRREGSARLVDAAMATNVGRFVQESFAPIYEDGADLRIDEHWPQRPVPYNRTVLDAERSAARFGAAGGRATVLRFAYFYGGDSRVLKEMAGMIAKGWAPLPGTRSSFVSSISHDDAASAVVAALDAPGGTYNVTDDVPLTRGEWVDAFADAMGLKRPKPLPYWMVALGGRTMELLGRSQRMSNARFRMAAGWAPRWPSARDGLQEVAAEWRDSAVS